MLQRIKYNAHLLRFTLFLGIFLLLGYVYFFPYLTIFML